MLYMISWHTYRRGAGITLSELSLPEKSRKSDPIVTYALPFRVMRFPITDDSYEVVVTNLDRDEFPSDILRQLYAMRWGIETSFRDLKYTIGLLHFHSKKYDYKVNFSVAVHICRKFLWNKCIPPDIEATIARYITPIRPGRSSPTI